MKSKRMKMIEAYDLSKNNINDISYSTNCYCYNCMEAVSSKKVVKYSGTGAICPNCGSATLIPDNIDFEITPDFLMAMKKYWS